MKYFLLTWAIVASFYVVYYKQKSTMLYYISLEIWAKADLFDTLAAKCGL